MNDLGINAEFFSVDRDTTAYDTMYEMILADSIDCYPYPVLIEELQNVELVNGGRKIDHTPEGCMIGSTKIPLLDGSFIRIDEMEASKDYEVYSVGPDLKITRGIATKPRTTGIKETVIVELDDGSEIGCTPCHPILLLDGTYRKAGELKKDDRLFPFYRRWTPMGGKSL